jgi:hypothetical protein
MSSRFDDDGELVCAGDTLRFSYGIPPVGVTANVVRRGKTLMVLTPGHKPTECALKNLRKCVGNFYKVKA